MDDGAVAAAGAGASCSTSTAMTGLSGREALAGVLLGACAAGAAGLPLVAVLDSINRCDSRSACRLASAFTCSSLSWQERVHTHTHTHTAHMSPGLPTHAHTHTQTQRLAGLRTYAARDASNDGPATTLTCAQSATLHASCWPQATHPLDVHFAGRTSTLAPSAATEVTIQSRGGLVSGCHVSVDKNTVQYDSVSPTAGAPHRGGCCSSPPAASLAPLPCPPPAVGSTDETTSYVRGFHVFPNMGSS